MAERQPISVQDVSNMLARQVARARQAQASGERLEGLQGLAAQFQAVDNLGWFTPDTEPAPRITTVETSVPPTLQSERERILVMPDLRERTLALLSSPLLREPTPDEQEVVERKMKLAGFSIPAKPLGELVPEDPGYFWKGEGEYLDARPSLRDYTLPQATYVAINPDPHHIALRGSFNESRRTQLDMIEDYSQARIVKEFGENAVAIMLPAIGYTAADYSYFHQTATRGKKLIRDFFARALDNTSGVGAAVVGRGGPGDPLSVGGWDADGGLPDVGAVPAVVFLRK